MGMASLEQVTSGEWFEIRERLRHPRRLYEHLVSSHSDETAATVLGEAASELERAIEGGVFEFRRHALAHLFSELAEAEFSSEIFARLSDLERRVTAMILASSCQRALISGDLAFSDPASAEQSDDTAHGVPGEGTPREDKAGPATARDVNEIMSDIKEILAADPSARMNTAIKNILLQLQRYREEAATYRKLKEQATSYRLEMYSKTFASTFRQIFESIRKNYSAFLEEQQGIDSHRSASPVRDLDVKAWVRILTGEMEELSFIRSTLIFVADKQSGMRGPLVRLARRRDEVLALVDEEEEAAADATGGEGAVHTLSRILAQETAGVLRRWISR
ncbi:MAG: hypothetical protein MI724_20180 [Spirochaetales bacterium]|nr:hypothetical protein [Spirochaetales bacterium]